MNYNIDIVEYCKSKIVKTKKENRWATVLLEMCDDMIYMKTTKLLHGDNLPSTVSFCRVSFDNLCLANQLFFPLKNNGIKFYLSSFTILHFLALLFPSFPAALSGKKELPVVVNLGRHVEGRINHSSIVCSVGGDGGDLSIFQ